MFFVFLFSSVSVDASDFNTVKSKINEMNQNIVANKSKIIYIKDVTVINAPLVLTYGELAVLYNAPYLYVPSPEKYFEVYSRNSKVIETSYSKMSKLKPPAEFKSFHTNYLNILKTTIKINNEIKPFAKKGEVLTKELKSKFIKVNSQFTSIQKTFKTFKNLK